MTYLHLKLISRKKNLNSKLKKNSKRKKNQKLFKNRKKNKKASKFNLQVNLKMIEKEDFSNKDRK
jgi:hypothetical protein